MIIFNELRITPDGKSLIIDAEVSDLKYFKDVYIESIYIDNQDTFAYRESPSTNPVFSYKVEDKPSVIYALPECGNCNPVKDKSDKAVCFTEDTSAGEKRVRLELNSSVLGSLKDNMFFIFIKTSGVPSADCPCNSDKEYHLGIAAHLYPFYKSIIGYMKQLNNECDTPKAFIDAILRFKALELNIKLGHYTEAIKYWNRWFKNIKTNTITLKTCSCG